MRSFAPEASNQSAWTACGSTDAAHRDSCLGPRRTDQHRVVGALHGNGVRAVGLTVRMPVRLSKLAKR